VRRLLVTALLTCLASFVFATAAQADATDYAVKSFSASISTDQAGGHPDFTTSFELTRDQESGELFASTRDLTIDLPPGLSGNPNVVSKCTAAQLVTTDVNDSGNENSCPVDSQVGITEVTLFNGSGAHTLFEPIYMMEPPGGEAVARLGFIAEVFPTFIDLGVRSDGDYGLSATVRGAGSLIPLLAANTTIWGVPGAAIHNPQRITPYEAVHCAGEPCTAPGGEPRQSGLPPAPFFSNPTRCGAPLETRITATSYALPDRPSTLTDDLPQIVGCGKLGFDPSLVLAPTSRQAAAPTGLDADLEIPQDETVLGLATSQLRYAKVVLPEGVTLATGAGDGLEACSAEQVGLGTREPAHCPDAAKIASAEFGVPALARTLNGAVYQRTPVKGDLFGIWLVADELGVHVKLPGSVHADPQTGQLTASFVGTPQTEGNPQISLESFRLHFKGGARGVLAAPEACGTYLAQYEMTPWSGGLPVSGTAPMTFDAGCDTGGFNPKLSAGTTSVAAGAFASFVANLTRESGEQNVAGFELELPPGLLARLAGVPLCEGAAAQSGDCPPASQVGSVTAATGPGPSPLWIPQPGKDPTAIYLSGPYEGAPYSVVAKVPAQAGPFDLGDVITRAGVYVDPDTALVSVRADRLPQILEGVPISYRTIHTDVDRPRFFFNPTSCALLQTRARVTSKRGVVATPTSPFRAGGCQGLAFKPGLSLRLVGKTNRGAHPRLHAVLTTRPGDANIKSLQLRLPHSEFLDQAHIRTICTRVQFAAGNCPPGSIYGQAKVITPVFDQPLHGPVYLRSSSHQLPDLVFALTGPVDINVVGRIDSVDGGIRATFSSVPDAPLTKAEVTMQGGAKGLLVNSRNICTTSPRSTLRLRGHNDKRAESHPVLRSSC
jgi:hypothetical protein